MGPKKRKAAASTSTMSRKMHKGAAEARQATDMAAEVAADMQEAARLAAEVAAEVEGEAAPATPAEAEAEAPEQPPEQPPDETPPQEQPPPPAPPAKRKKAEPLDLDDRQRKELAEYVQENALLYDHSIKGWNDKTERDKIWQRWARKENLDRMHLSSTALGFFIFDI